MTAYTKRLAITLQSNVVLEHDIIVHLRVSDIGDDNIVEQNDRLFMMSADTFRSELLTKRDRYVTESEIRAGRNQEYGENGWWGLRNEYGGRLTVDERGQVTQVFLPSQFHPPADLSLAGEKGLKWSQKYPSKTVTILPANTRTNDILPQKIFNTDMTALVDHPFRQYRPGRKVVFGSCASRL